MILMVQESDQEQDFLEHGHLLISNRFKKIKCIEDK